jgi:hypothetical protein
MENYLRPLALSERVYLQCADHNARASGCRLLCLLSYPAKKVGRIRLRSNRRNLGMSECQMFRFFGKEQPILLFTVVRL